MNTLVCDYVGSNYPGGKGSTRKFFSLFPRSISDEVTHEIISRLGFGDSLRYCDESGKPDLFATYKALPALDPAVSSFALIQAHGLFSKNWDMKTDIDREAAAYSAFLQSESDCAKVNLRFFFRELSGQQSSILHYASRYVSNVLGACPRIDEMDYAFGPGACVTDRRTKHTSPPWKLASTPTASNSLMPLLDELRATFPSWLGTANVVPATGRLEFVPKSHKIDRSIMIEPMLNGLLQKGVGSLMKRKLMRHGIDLRDQSVQRQRARVGSIENTWATIDLSRASDSIAYALVMELVPFDWFELLDRLRTPIVRYRKSTIVLEKFSSMGNGFTFELETLIFKALIHGIANHFDIEDDSVCYGDDITCSKPLAEKVLEFFPEFGFTVNKEKSFIDGPFREACGGDYRLGIDVRPFFLKSLSDGGRWSPAKLVSFYNFLKRKPWFDTELSDYILSLIPRSLRRWGPDGYGDGHLISLSDPSTYLPRVHSKNNRGQTRRQWYEGFHFETFIANAHRVCAPENVGCLPAYAVSAGLSRESPYDLDVVRPPKGSFLSSRLARVTYLEGSPKG